VALSVLSLLALSAPAHADAGAGSGARPATICTEVSLTTQAEVDAFSCTSVSGTLIITGPDITNLDGLTSLTSVGASLWLIDNPLLSDISGLSNLVSIGFDLRIMNNASLTNLDGLSSLTTAGRVDILDNQALTRVDGMPALTASGDGLRIENCDALVAIDGFPSLMSARNLIIDGCDALTSMDGLPALTFIEEELSIRGNAVLANISGLGALTSVGIRLVIWSNPQLTCVSGPVSLNNVALEFTLLQNPMLDVCVAFGPLFTSGTFGALTLGSNLPGCNLQSEIVASWEATGPFVITDDTAGTAVNDGVIDPGEYVGASGGIGSGFGRVIGLGSRIHLDSDLGGALNIALETCGGGLFDQGVIYVDSQPGGSPSTALFTDNADPLRAAISALAQNGSGDRSDITFAPGFEADFAIGFEAGFAGVWALVEGGAHTFLTTANINPAGAPVAGEFEIDLALADLGLSPGDSFDYVVTYVNSMNAFRSDEFHGVSLATVGPGNIGQNPISLAAGDWNTFEWAGPVSAEPVLEAPASFALRGSHPNPFGASTTIAYELPRTSRVELRVLDAAGRLVRVLESAEKGPGRHSAVWNGRNGSGERVANGVYFYRLEAGEFRETKKVVHVR
jgi:hypothetical protein